MLLTIKATVFYFSVLGQKKIQNLMREGGKKQNIEPIFEKFNEVDRMKKT